MSAIIKCHFASQLFTCVCFRVTDFISQPSLEFTNDCFPLPNNKRQLFVICVPSTISRILVVIIYKHSSVDLDPTMTSRLKMVITFLLLIQAATTAQTTTSTTTTADTCDINGQLYLDREPLDLTSRCGSADDFPCFCNPNIPGQVECPYCSFATFAETNPLCATHNQQVTFLDVNGVSQTCGCQIPQPFSTPTFSCVPTPTDDDADTTCWITLANGSREQYNRGDLITGRETRCGSDFFCRCNPDVQGQMECPFCTFATDDGGLACAHDDESVFLTNPQGNELVCSCQINQNDMENPVTNCVPGVATPSPISLPTPTPTTLQTRGPTEDAPSDPILWPIFAPTPQTPTPSATAPITTPPPFLRSPTPVPTPIPIPIPIPIPTLRPSLRPGVEASDRCQLELDDGSILEFARGQSYQNYLSTRCRGPSSEFPCFCNPDLPGQRECPYCGFALSGGELKCAKDGEMVTFQDQDAVWQTCSCAIIPEGNGVAPIQSCQATGAPPTPSPTTLVLATSLPTSLALNPNPNPNPNPNVDPLPGVPTSAPVATTDGCIWESSSVTRGQSLGPLLAGPCGDASEWPYICNPSVAGGQEYPYCEFTTLLGDILCAKSGPQQPQVEFIDANGNPQSCSCSYFNPALGPQGICREWKMPTDSPTHNNDMGSSLPPVATTTPTTASTTTPTDAAPTTTITTATTESANEDFSFSFSKRQVIFISVGLSVALMICILLSIFYWKRRKTYEY
jgi:hypothetical protein